MSDVNIDSTLGFLFFVVLCQHVPYHCTALSAVLIAFALDKFSLLLLLLHNSMDDWELNCPVTDLPRVPLLVPRAYLDWTIRKSGDTGCPRCEGVLLPEGGQCRSRASLASPVLRGGWMCHGHSGEENRPQLRLKQHGTSRSSRADGPLPDPQK